MALSVVNFSSGGQNGGPFTTVVSASQNITAGNSIVVGIRLASGVGASSVLDTAGNAYTPLPVISPGGSDFWQYWVVNNCVGNLANVVTAAIPSTSYTVIAVWQIAGGLLGLGSQIFGTGTGSTLITPSFSTTVNDEIVLSLGLNTGALTSFTAVGPAVLDASGIASGTAGAEHTIYTSIQTGVTVSMTQGTSANSWELVACILKKVLPAPAPISISMPSGSQGITYPTFTVTGTNFDAGGTSTLSFSGTGITINSYGTRNATTLVANISIASGASLGARDVIVTNASTFTGTLPGAFTILPAPPPADILVLLPFSKRTTAAVVVFACIGIASPAGAQSIPTTATNIGALSLEYAQLNLVYAQLRHQDTANNESDLFAAINLAVTIATSLNTTIQSMTATGDAGVKLAAMQIVAANALTQLLKVQEDEFGTPF